MKAAIYGDPHDGMPLYPNAHANVVAKILLANPDAVFCLGDLKHTTMSTFAGYEAVAGALLIPGKYHPMRGNHDSVAGTWTAYDAFASPFGGSSPYYRTVTMGQVTFFLLDCWNPSEAPPSCTDYTAQQNWLQDALTLSESPFKVVLMHTPMFSSSTKGPNACVRNAFRTIIDAGADCSIAGHRHDYERYWWGAAQHITAGSCLGHVLHPVAPDPVDGRQAWSESVHWLKLEVTETAPAELTMTIEAVRPNGVILDTVSWTKPYHPSGSGKGDPPPNEE